MSKQYDDDDSGSLRKTTFRVRRDLLKELRIEAKDKKQSSSQILNEILEQYLAWYKLETKAGFIAVRKRLIIKLLEGYDDRQIEKIAEDVFANTMKDVALFFKYEYTLGSVRDILNTWLRFSGYQYRYSIHGTVHSYHIIHKMGKKWSVYLSSLMKDAAKEFGLEQPDFVMEDEFLSAKFDIPIQRKL